MNKYFCIRVLSFSLQRLIDFQCLDLFVFLFTLVRAVSVCCVDAFGFPFYN